MAPPAAADAEPQGQADQDSDHGHGLLRMRNRSTANPATGTSTDVLCDTLGLAQVQTYYSTGVLLCAYAGMRIQRYDDMMVWRYGHITAA